MDRPYLARLPTDVIPAGTRFASGTNLPYRLASIVRMTQSPGGSPPVERVRHRSHHPSPITHHPPTSTYRVQLNAGFTFADARAIVPYLHDLGIGALYTSPFLCATPGSTHGYDVTDYGSLNPEIGTEEDLRALTARCASAAWALLVDVVPNHMGIAGGANAWWQDVLENGRTSPYAEFFDIDWRPLKEELRGKILLPVLGDHYGVVLERGELRLEYADGAFTVHYYETPPADRPAHLPDDPHHGAGTGRSPLSQRDGRGAGGEGISLPKTIPTSWNSRASSPPSSGCHRRTSATPI